MLELNPNTLYSKDDLAGLLEPLGLSIEAFLDRVKPRKIFKSVYYGRDLLDALDRASEIRQTAMKPVATRSCRKRSDPHEATIRHTPSHFSSIRAAIDK